MMGDVWEARIRRAEQLQPLWGFAQEVLRFFRAVTSFQQQLYHRARATTPKDPKHLDTDFLTSFFPPFLSLVERHGPPEVAQLAQKFKDRQEADWERILRSYWHRNGNGGDVTVQFFPKAILQPYTMHRAERWREEVGSWGDPEGTCPFCNRPPVVSLLRDDKDADAIGRSLVCSLCSTEWGFPRILCPGCKEEQPEKLPRYPSRDIPWMRVEACDRCKRFLKAVDLRKCPDAEPVVDEIGSTPLDASARDRGYTKLESNIVGA